MPLWYKTKLVYSLLFQAVFLPSSDDLNNMVYVMTLVISVNLSFLCKVLVYIP